MSQSATIDPRTVEFSDEENQAYDRWFDALSQGAASIDQTVASAY